MYNWKETRICSDTVKLLMLAAVLFAALAVAYVSFESDDSSAETVDGTTYFYDQLTDIEKAIYDEYTNFTLTTYTDPDTAETYPALFISLPIDSSLIGEPVDYVGEVYSVALDKVSDALLYDKPDDCWLGKRWYYKFIDAHQDSSGNLTDGSIGFYNCQYVDFGADTVPGIKAAKTELETKIAQVEAAATPTDLATQYATLKYIHDYVCNTLEYDHTMAEGMFNRNAHTALVDDSHCVVCEGYARAFKALCDEFDIPCLVVIGTGITGGSPGNHMWNVVQMSNDKWYLVDCTWDDMTMGPVYTYFMVGSDSDGDEMKVGQDHLVSTTEYTRLSVPTISVKGYLDDNFTVTFQNYDGTVLQTGDYPFEGTVTAPAVDPTRPDDEYGVYSFTGWSPEFNPTVTQAVTYVAQYSIEYTLYTISFNPMNGDPAIVKADYHYGDAVIVPDTPSKAAEPPYTFTFDKWSPNLVRTVQGDASYTAIYERVVVTGPEGFLFTDAVKTEISGTDMFTVNIKDESGGDVAKITFNQQAIAGLATGQTLTVLPVKISDLDPAVQGNLEGAKAFSIDFGTNTTFAADGKATVALYYEKSAIDKIAGITLYYVNGDTLEQLGYNYEDNYVVFETTHFSDYAIKSVLGLSGIYWYIPIIAILIFAIIGFALAYRYG